MSKRKLLNSGFTIVELLIVIVIIGILAALVIVAYNGVTARSTTATIQSDLANAAKRLKLDQVDSTGFPTTLALANGGQGIKATGSTTYQYSVDNSASPQTFCITATNGSTSYYINESTGPKVGACFGHTTGTPLTCPSGFIIVPGSSTYGTNDFCVMKYEAKQASGTVPVSTATGVPWYNISQTTAATYSANVAGCTGCHLITDAEWLTIAQNVLSVGSNWSSGVVGSGYLYSGNNDTSSSPNVQAADAVDTNNYVGTGNSAGDSSVTCSMIGKSQRRTLTLTNGEVIWDLAGNTSEWTSGTITTGTPGIAAGGLAYRDWTAITTIGTISPSPYPTTATASASSWTSAGQGIGQIYSNSADTSLRGFMRGGYINSCSTAGVFTLVTAYAPSFIDNTLGFRVSR